MNHLPRGHNVVIGSTRKDVREVETILGGHRTVVRRGQTSFLSMAVIVIHVSGANVTVCFRAAWNNRERLHNEFS